MRTARLFRASPLLLGLALLLHPAAGFARAEPPPVTAPAPRPDGQHDFDFEFGDWTTHIRRLERPLTGSTSWVEYDGGSIVRKVWGGQANLGEIDVSGPAGRIQGLSLRLYDPQTPNGSSASPTAGTATSALQWSAASRTVAASSTTRKPWAAG